MFPSITQKFLLLQKKYIDDIDLDDTLKLFAIRLSTISLLKVNFGGVLENHVVMFVINLTSKVWSIHQLKCKNPLNMSPDVADRS